MAKHNRQDMLRIEHLSRKAHAQGFDEGYRAGWDAAVEFLAARITLAKQNVSALTEASSVYDNMAGDNV